ncbi:hypothetical protein SALBM217S_06358 [Streptomyces griseoloalbus]
MRGIARVATAALLSLSSVAGFAAAAQAEPIDYVRIELLELTCHQQSRAITTRPT